MTKRFAGLALAAVVCLIGGTVGYIQYLRASDPYANCRAGSVGGGDIGGPFSLVDQTGASVTEKDVITKPTLIYFGYTFCPDVCPLDNARNAEAVDILEEKGITAVPVFITIDPKRDTPEVMADYVANVHPSMIGLTGTPDQIRAASLAYKTYFKVQEGDPEFYLVDHSTFTYFVTPGSGFVDFFKRDDPAELVADRVSCYLGQ